MTYLHTTVPPPLVTIIGSPLDESFHAGIDLTLTGRSQFSPAVITPINVEAVWIKTGPSSVLSADGRVSIGEAVMVGVNPMVFESNLTITSLMESDSGTYTLFLNFSSTEPFTIGATISEERNITVLGKLFVIHCHVCGYPLINW